ncbi:MAG: peptide chain release factor 3 [Mesorhizobium sp.]
MGAAFDVQEAVPPADSASPFLRATSSSRRTFAIISHPDAGKTTLTEKLLFESGSIRLAGEVKARGERRRTRSDWMEIEQKRGISISSSVMTFEHEGLTMNLLDTPGHSDFSEDTFRTLTAVDSAIMVIDAAKGIESQTWKLFEVCRMRNIPIMTFINKVDREGREPLDLLDEIMDRLALDVAPLAWPVGMGVDFQGVLDLVGGQMVLPDGSPGAIRWTEDSPLTKDPELRKDRIFGPSLEGLEIVRASLSSFDPVSYRDGHQTPVFFGSALRNVGVRELLHALAKHSPGPQPQPAAPEPIDPSDDEVSGFVFKVQANMDPNHRDRIAFVRLCSGRFTRGMKLKNVRSGRELKVPNPMFFFARERELAEEAVAGDIVGIPNHGTLSVGDTLTERIVRTVTGIPNFAPEIIRRVRILDTSKMKQLSKAMDDLSEEGVIQLFRPIIGSTWFVGAVGPLQFEVLVARAAAEYGVDVMLEASQFETARWISSNDKEALERFAQAERNSITEDRAGTHVYFARNEWELARTQRDWPDIEFWATRERG